MHEGNPPNNWRDIILSDNASIKDAIEKLNVSRLKTVYIVSEDGILLGSINDGDIRRSFYDERDLTEKAVNISNTSPIVGGEQEPENLYRSKIQFNNLFSLPIVDVNFKLTNVIFNTFLIRRKKRDTPVVIMAGGFGKRLGKLTIDTPKPLIRVGGVPIIQHIIQNLSGLGFKEFHISLHYLGEKIKNYLGDGSEYGVNINYLIEEFPLGTAGCLNKISSSIRKDVIIVNGDVFCDVNFSKLIDFHQKNQKDATVVIKKHEITNPYGEIKVCENEFINIVEKPTYYSFINTGIYVLSEQSIKLINENEKIDMPSLLKRIQENEGKINVFETDEYWLDIGNPIDLSRIDKIII